MDPRAFRANALSTLTNEIGVYALCDLDEVPIYVGKSVDGILSRVRRHLTSARSDVIANRQIDVWEVAYVWAWPVVDIAEIGVLEASVFHEYDAVLTLMNGQIPAADGLLPLENWPAKESVQVISDEEIENRSRPSERLSRQIQQYQVLVDYILVVKEAEHLKRSARAHFERLLRYHQQFL